jgi:serine/threonine-protein kinase
VLLPPEVSADIEDQFQRDLRWISKLSAVIYTSMLGFLAMIVWMGIRQPLVVGAFVTLTAITAAASIRAALSQHTSHRVIGVAMVSSALAFALGTRFVSPLLLVPTALAVNSMGYAVFLRRGSRGYVMAAGALAFAVPLVLELVGALSPTFQFAHGELRVLPVALELPEVPTLVLIATATLAGMVLGVFILGYMRDRLQDAERRLYLHSWHLRELLPEEVATSSRVG